MDELWLWIKAFGGHWWALMSCAIFTVLGVAVLILKKSNTWALGATFGVAAVLLLFASFLAWRDKHRDLVALQDRLKSPEFGFTRSTVLWGTHTQAPPIRKNLGVVVSGFITNPHGPRSAAVNWQMKLETLSKSEIGVTPFSTGQDVKLPLPGTGTHIILKHSSYWPSTTAKPIEPGGIAEGWFIGLFKDISEADLGREDGTVTLSFDDVVSGKPHSFTIRIDKSMRGVKVPDVI